MTTEQEKAQVNEPEATPETTHADEVKRRLAQQVKTCLLQSQSCKGLGNKFQEVAEELGVGFDELLDEVFELATAEEG